MNTQNTTAGTAAASGQAGGNPRPSWKTWQSDDDIPQRRQLIQHILVLFQQRKPMVNQDWNQKLPDFVQRLEEALYRTAASKEEYQNYSTLESRLQSVARKMVSRGGPRSGDPNASATAAAAGTSSQQQQQLTRQQQQLAQQQTLQGSNGATGTAPSAASTLVPTVNGVSGQIQQQVGNGMLVQQQQVQGTPQGTPSTAGAAAPAPAGASTPMTDAQRAAMQAEQQRVYISKQQRWLLLLRHASKCNVQQGTCSATPHCTVAKQLVQHVTQCQSSQCTYPRCVAARDLLRHHMRCQEVKCVICTPVREYMQRQKDCELQARAQGQSQMVPTNLGRTSTLVPADGFSGGVKVEDDQKPAKRQRYDDGTAGSTGVNKIVVKREAGVGRTEGASLLETFTLQQVHIHLNGLREWAASYQAQQNNKRGKDLAAHLSMGHGQSQCKSCGLEHLLFEPPPLYCGTCGVRIKKNQVHYVANPPQAATAGAGEVTKHLMCSPCYNDIKGDSLELEGMRVPKTSMLKRKNDEEAQQLEEPWVECDRCQSWHHQICVLFNGRKNDGEQTVFHCPLCIKRDMQAGLRLQTTQRSQAQLPAEALPRTKLSDFLEQRLRIGLVREREERAKRLGKRPEEVMTAEGLSVRLVSNVEKKVDTRPRFSKAFPNFPKEFPYKSKVLLLFQKIDGIDVCLFAIYMQEYGADAPLPNRRRVYLSYLDSIKYFRPELQSSRGYALRTYIYQELLVGYLQYIKVRGFTSIYIWACPPLAGEDYILYCHPSKQKTPKSDKLRAWYQAMLQQAKAEKIVTHLGTIYDTFFQCGRNKETLSAAAMPYLDGDYWPGSADEHLLQMDAEARGGKAKGGVSKAKSAKAKVRGVGIGTSKLQPFDAQLMNQLGEILGGPMKEDFIIAHLHHCCTHCGQYIHNGKRWYVEAGPHIELCDTCYRLDLQRPNYERVQYPLVSEDIKELRDTRDPDDILESEFFDTRQAFLSLCQGNHFQFDTLRRAKHSSMMVLYHLHNPSEPAFVANCNICQAEISAGAGWRCTVCPDYDMCDACYRTQKHPHELTRDKTGLSGGRKANGVAYTEEERRQRAAHLQRTMALLVHASACNLTDCKTPDCHKVKTLFRHGVECPKKAAGGCHCCRRVCTLLHVHAKSCKLAHCPVPQCSELKDYRRRLQMQMEDRRRQNAMAMYRGQTQPDED